MHVNIYSIVKYLQIIKIFAVIKYILNKLKRVLNNIGNKYILLFCINFRTDIDFAFN